MISEAELAELAEYEGDGPVLSAYLDTDLTQQSKEAVHLRWREAQRGLVPKSRKEDLEAIESFLAFEYDWQASGLAIFAGPDLWRVYPLPVPPATQGYVGPKPYLRVLTNMAERFGRYAVALFDREGARLLAVNGGRIEEIAEALGEQVKRHRQGGWSAAGLQRQADNVARQNIVWALEQTEAFCREHDCQQLVLAGSQEVLALVRELLPSSLRELVVGDFVCDVRATPAHVLSRSFAVVDRLHARQERELVSQAITSAAKGGPGAVGLADVLFSLQQKRVHRLLVKMGFRAQGRRCRSCGYVAAQEVEACPICAKRDLEPVADVVDEAVKLALSTGAQVHVIEENDELIEAGGVAAILRY